MSQEDLWAVVGRAKSDREFAGSLFRDFEGAVRQSGYALTDEEMRTAKAAASDGPPPQAFDPSQHYSPLQEIQDSLRFNNEEMRKRVRAQSERMIGLNQFTVDTLKKTIGHSADTYKRVTLMNQVMFWMGVVLFVCAAFDAAVMRDLRFSGAFAGLGAASFIGFFFLGPIQKTQSALSNLIQAEIAFMNYFEQLSFLENYSTIPGPNAPGLLDPERIERASDLLQQRSQQTMELLQKYLEEERGSESRKRSKGAAAG